MHWQCTSCDIKSENRDDHKFDSCKQNGHRIVKMLSPSEIRTACKSPPKQEKRPIKKVKGNIGPYFVESITIGVIPFFLCYNHITNKVELREEIEHLDSKYIPLEPQECGYPPYSFTKEEIENLIQTELKKEDILDEIKSQIDRYINVREVDKYLILSDVFLSYNQEWVNTLHYPFFVGETESGKSSCLHIFKRIGYRCLYGEDIPNADIYNFLGIDEEGTGIIAEDEAQDLEKSKEKISTYKNSYSRGSLKPRIITTANSKKQVYYKTFCLKVFAGERIPQNKGFLERLAIVHMVEGETNGNIKRLTTQEEIDLSNLRNKLLVWKVQNITKGIERIDCGLKQRDQELWEDFLSVVHGTKYYDSCKNVVGIYVEQRHEAIKNSFEAKIFEFVVNKLKGIELESLTIWQEIIDNLPGRLEETKGTFYSDDYGQITKNRISRLLQDKFQASKISKYEKMESKYHKKTLYIFKSEVIRRLTKKYQTSLPSESTISSNPSGLSGQIKEESLDHLDNLDHYNV